MPHIILHIKRDLNPKHILSKKPVLSTFKASRVHEVCCLWTEADKSILANQSAVFRSGDKATFTLKRRASWEEFRQSWLKVIEDG